MTSSAAFDALPGRFDRPLPGLPSFDPAAAVLGPLRDPPLLARRATAGEKAAPPPHAATGTGGQRRAEPNVVGSEEPKRLDPARAAIEPEQPSPASRLRRSLFAPIASIAVHLMPLALLLDWSSTPAPIAAPVPVTLVIEKPQPPPPPAPPVEKRRPPGALASEDVGAPAQQKPEAAAPPPQPQPSETKLAAVEPPKPAGLPALESALPLPVSPPDIADLPKVDKPGPQYKEPPKHVVVARLPPNRNPAPHAGRVPGPDATRDEYLVYCAAMIRRNESMLPPSVLAGRKGMAVLSLTVLDDGTIARVAVKQSSGYPEIDQSAERMVAAVHRFPPLPQWYQGPKVSLNYQFAFRDGALVH